MDKQTFLNTKYKALCQQLGEATFKQSQLTELIDSLKNQIETLNKSYATMEEYEALSQESGE